ARSRFETKWRAEQSVRQEPPNHIPAHGSGTPKRKTGDGSKVDSARKDKRALPFSPIIKVQVTHVALGSRIGSRIEEVHLSVRKQRIVDGEEVFAARILFDLSGDTAGTVRFVEAAPIHLKQDDRRMLDALAVDAGPLPERLLPDLRRGMRNQPAQAFDMHR